MTHTSHDDAWTALYSLAVAPLAKLFDKDAGRVALWSHFAHGITFDLSKTHLDAGLAAGFAALAEAAREAGPGLIAEDLPEVLPAVHRRIYDEFGIDY